MRDSPISVYISPSRKQKERKKGPNGERLCRRCLQPISNAASHRVHQSLHRECYLLESAEIRAKRKAGKEKTVGEIEVTKLKSPFDVLKMIQKLE